MGEIVEGEQAVEVREQWEFLPLAMRVVSVAAAVVGFGVALA